MKQNFYEVSDYSLRAVRLFSGLDSPKKIQDFLDSLAINFESRGESIQSPLRVLQSRRAHCLEGAMLAAAILEFHGHKPLLMDLRARPPEEDHVVALFRQGGFWGSD